MPYFSEKSYQLIVTQAEKIIQPAVAPPATAG